MDVEHVIDQNVHPMDFWLDEDFQLIVPNAGDIVEGTIVAHHANEILVNIGAKSEGIIPSREVEAMSEATKAQLSIGACVPVYVADVEDSYGHIILSYKQAIAEQGWHLAEKLLHTHETYPCQITAYNKGGLLTDIHNIRAFIPSSQLGGPPPADLSTDEYLGQFVGQTLESRVIEVDRRRNRLILSAHVAAKRLRDKRRTQLLDQLQEGHVVKGKIVNLEHFGAFVDIGGLQGLIHLSEFSWKRIGHPSEVVQLGEKLEVYVLSVDREKQRVALSLKRLVGDPWQTIDERYEKGQLVEATITKLARYGAFARLHDEFELEGLIHISELAHERVQKPSEVVARDQVVTARIIHLNSSQRQLGLSLKQVTANKYRDLDLTHANDDNLTAGVDNS